jgi:hypothetical protein
MPSSMYTTSSVATFPDAPLAYGQPPSPATDESTTEMPSCTHAHAHAHAHRDTQHGRRVSDGWEPWSGQLRSDRHQRRWWRAHRAHQSKLHQTRAGRRASKARARTCRATRMLGSAVLYVLWKCTATASTGTWFLTACSIAWHATVHPTPGHKQSKQRVRSPVAACAHGDWKRGPTGGNSDGGSNFAARTWGSHANRVSQRDFVATHLVQ